MVLVVARFVGVILTWETIFVAIGLMFALAFGLTAFGIVMANYVRGFESFGVFSNAVILPLYFTASSVFPLDPALTRAQTLVTYPEWLVIIVEYNPLTYAVDAMRGILIKFNQFDPALGFQVVGVMAVGLFVLAMWEFRKV
ncbi:ABC transporter permease [Pelagibacterium sp.]|uniref:ABC transporter permease n=1 Tax=Pelagibacterium sp. TaxID=1967288 RepID=UPI003BA9B97A